MTNLIVTAKATRTILSFEHEHHLPQSSIQIAQQLWSGLVVHKKESVQQQQVEIQLWLAILDQFFCQDMPIVVKITQLFVVKWTQWKFAFCRLTVLWLVAEATWSVAVGVVGSATIFHSIREGVIES